MSPEKERFLKWLAERAEEGTPYCWPAESNGYLGKGLKSPERPVALDCSGAVTCGLYVATGGRIDWRADKNAQRLWMELPGLKVGDQPEPGDVACYGTLAHCSHVMVMAEDGHRVVGAAGGDRRTLTVEIARATGAQVKYRRHHLYRPDFIGWRRLPL